MHWTFSTYAPHCICRDRTEPGTCIRKWSWGSSTASDRGGPSQERSGPDLSDPSSPRPSCHPSLGFIAGSWTDDPAHPCGGGGTGGGDARHQRLRLDRLPPPGQGRQGGAAKRAQARRGRGILLVGSMIYIYCRPCANASQLREGAGMTEWNLGRLWGGGL